MGKKMRHDPIHDWLDAGIRRAFGDRRAWDEYYNKGDNGRDSSSDTGSSALQRRHTTSGIPRSRQVTRLYPHNNGLAPGPGNNFRNISQGAGYPTYAFRPSRGAFTHPRLYHQASQMTQPPPPYSRGNSEQLPYLGPAPGQFNQNPPMPNMGLVPQHGQPPRSAGGVLRPGQSPPSVRPSGRPPRPGQHGSQGRRATAPAQLPLRNPQQATQDSRPRANTDMYRLGDMQRTFIEGMVDPRQVQQHQRGR